MFCGDYIPETKIQRILDEKEKPPEVLPTTEINAGKFVKNVF